MVPWGMASDRFGRRSVLLLGPLGLSLAMLGFGASTQFYPLVFFGGCKARSMEILVSFLFPLSSYFYTEITIGIVKAIMGEVRIMAQPSITNSMFRLLY